MHPKPNHATVRRSLLVKKTAAECLSTCDNVCVAGAQSPDVQGSPPCVATLTALQKAVTTAHGSLNNKLALAQALMAAITAVRVDMTGVKVALGAYEASVNAMANGVSAVIQKAGLVSREPKPPALVLGKVSVVHTKVGKHPTEGIIWWPAGPGATGYAIEVNYTPQTPAGPWTALISGAGRRRVVKAPTPGAQLLARVASLGSGGTQSDWSDAVLVTTL